MFLSCHAIQAMQALRMVNEGSVGFDGNWLEPQQMFAPRSSRCTGGELEFSSFRYLRARSSAAVSKDGNIEEELRYPGPLHPEPRQETARRRTACFAQSGCGCGPLRMPSRKI